MITRAKALKLREMIEKAAVSLSDENALEAVELFPHWSSESVKYTPGDRVSYKGTLYKCIGSTSHVSQPSWAPDISPSIWVRVDNPAEEWPEWRQPTGATDAYMTGAKVSHNEKHWICTVDNNTWEPGVFGWEVMP